MGFLTDDEVREVVTALVSSGIDPAANRASFFLGIPGLMALIPGGMGATAQAMRDVGQLNDWERLPSGVIAVEPYLRNADLLLMGLQQQKVIREMLNRVQQRATGSPKIDVAQVREVREKIVHFDDTVTFAFMDAGVRAGASVMKLRVPRYDGGQPRTKNGNPDGS